MNSMTAGDWRQLEAKMMLFPAMVYNSSQAQYESKACCLSTISGLHLDWNPPPYMVEKGETFNITYWATADEAFFQDYSTTAYPDKK